MWGQEMQALRLFSALLPAANPSSRFPSWPPDRFLAPPSCAAAARFADQAAEPFDKEVTLCDQLASYLRKFQVAEAAAAQEEARDLSGALEGFKPIPVSQPGLAVWQSGSLAAASG